MSDAAAPAETATQTAPKPIPPFVRLGGAPVISAIVDQFYDLMENDPAYAELRAMHAPDLAPMRTSLKGFLTGWAGGPRDWFDANPGRCMMSMHSGFTISDQTAGQWAQAMRRAIESVATADQQMAKAMAGVLEELAMGMAR
ncbi:group II truncated hemoglobin [Novosphingobium ovatum]|uniref:group II truncated hemoglobin n=1 Tax=Novosphingobium ovatum TaxID=1908523 RepID=UPI001D127059|nr:group II truncated hemoglobin [Novosphingobium ovatum]